MIERIPAISLLVACVRDVMPDIAPTTRRFRRVVRRQRSVVVTSMLSDQYMKIDPSKNVTVSKSRHQLRVSKSACTKKFSSGAT